jgi:cardiolipin synthase C
MIAPMLVGKKPLVAKTPIAPQTQAPVAPKNSDAGTEAPATSGTTRDGATHDVKKVLGDVTAPKDTSKKQKSAALAGAQVGLAKVDETNPSKPKKSLWQKMKTGVTHALIGLAILNPSFTFDAARVALDVPLHHAERLIEKATGKSLHRSALDVRMAQMQNMERIARGPAPASAAAAFDALQTIGGGEVQARLLSTNLDAWNGRWADLETAKTSIDASYFIFEKDPFGYAYLGHLLQRQMDGAQVRVSTDAMADTFGKNGFKMPGNGKDYLQELVNHGGKAYIYHPIWQRPLDALKLDYAVLASNHDKIQVVDGKLSITGGRNIAKDYFASPTDMKDAWRDIDVAMDGAGAAKAMTAAFDAELHGPYARPVSADRLGNWDKKDNQLLGAYHMMDMWLKDAPLSQADKDAARASPEAQQKFANDLVARTLAKLPRAASSSDREFLVENAKQLVTHLEARGSRHTYEATREAVRSADSKVIDQTSAAGERVNDMGAAMMTLVRGAQKSIVIENPYVVLTEDMVQAMEDAAKRGVKIEIITNSPLSTDSDVTQAFFLEDFAYLLARVPTARVWVTTGETKFHGKSAVIDEEISLVTTYNLDLLSGYVNSEVGAVLKSKDFARDLLSSFERDRADPRHNMLEYTIQRDANGKAVLVDGKPVVTFGPEHHLPKDLLETYAKKRKTWGETLRENIPYLAPLRHPGLGGSGGSMGGGN